MGVTGQIICEEQKAGETDGLLGRKEEVVEAVAWGRADEGIHRVSERISDWEGDLAQIKRDFCGGL
jgi:hypothetical protein